MNYDDHLGDSKVALFELYNDALNVMYVLFLSFNDAFQLCHVLFSLCFSYFRL